MVIRLIYACEYCGSPRIEYKEIVRVKGISVASTAGDGVVEQQDYCDDSDYCVDCEEETRVVDAVLIYCDNELYEIIEGYSSRFFKVFAVPYEKCGEHLYFNGKPKLLCKCAYNDITETLLSTLYRKDASEDEKRSALQALLQLAGTNEAGVEENADASAY